MKDVEVWKFAKGFFVKDFIYGAYFTKDDTVWCSKI